METKDGFWFAQNHFGRKRDPRVQGLTDLAVPQWDGDSPTSLAVFSARKFLLMSNPNLPWHSLRAFPLILSLQVQTLG